MNTVLMWIGALLVAVFGAAFAVPHFIDWNGYRGVFEEEASRILGRRVRVGGEVNVRLLPAPYVRFEQIRIADTSGLSGAPFFRTENFTMWLSVPPLLKGVVEAHKIELLQPKLRLVLDNNGAGNWTSLSIVPGSLPFVPSDVALQSVEIVDGTVVVEKQNENEFARLAGLNGELVAEALKGPYAFRGTFDWNGTKRDLQVATGTPAKDGSVRLKARVRSPGTQDSYVVDGSVLNIIERPKFNGEVKAKVGINRVNEQPAAGTKTKQPLLDVRAKLAADARKASLSEIVAAFETDGQPQLIVGTANSDWTNKKKFDLNLSSRWLDLDKIYGLSSTNPTPMRAGRNILETVAGLLPADFPTTAQFRIDQVNLGGDAVSNIDIDLKRDSGPLQLNSLRADLPSGGRLELSGALSTATPTAPPAFDGNIFVSGPNLERLLLWGFGRAQTGDRFMNGPFQVQGDLSFTNNQIEFDNASGDISGLPLRGQVRYDGGDAHRMSIDVAGHEIDATWFGTFAKNPDSIATWVGNLINALDNTQQSTTQAGKALAEPDTARGTDTANFAGLSQLQLRLKAGRLKIAGQILREVVADLDLGDGRITVPSLRFHTAEGLAFEIDGGIEAAADRPRGRLSWTMDATGDNALTPLFNLVDDNSMRAWLEARRSRLAPSRIAGFISFGEGGSAETVISVDGIVRDGRVSALARMTESKDLLHKTAANSNSETKSWHTRPLDLTLAIENPDVTELVGLAFGANEGRQVNTDRSRPARAQLKAVGVPARGMRSIAAIEAEDLTIGFGGSIVVAQSGGPKVDGILNLALTDSLEILLPAGFPIARAAAGHPIEGAAAILSDSKTLVVKPTDMRVGGSVLNGALTFDRDEEDNPRLTGSLAADKLSVPGLLQLLVKPSRGIEGDPENLEIESAWPEAAFEADALSTLTGGVDVSFAEFLLNDDLAVKDGKFALALKRDGIDVQSFNGKALGGQATADLTLVNAAAGIRLAGRVQFQDAALQKLVETGGPGLASGKFGIEVVFEGQALGPAALMAGLRGKGELRLGQGTVGGMTPLAIRKVAKALLIQSEEQKNQPISETLRAALSVGGLTFAQRTLNIDIINGAARIAPFKLSDNAGTTLVTTTVDLATMKLDSEWRIEANSPSLPGAPKTFRKKLPPVRVAFVGTLSETGRLEPRIDADLFQRELSVAKMEYDVIKLEFLRKQDEERARAAAEAAEERRRLEQLQSQQPPGFGPPEVRPQ